jgi:hypothetical protein
MASTSIPSASQMLRNEKGQSTRSHRTQASASAANRRAPKRRRQRPFSMHRIASSRTASMSARGPAVSASQRTPEDTCAGKTASGPQRIDSKSLVIARVSFQRCR